MSCRLGSVPTTTPGRLGLLSGSENGLDESEHHSLSLIGGFSLEVLLDLLFLYDDRPTERVVVVFERGQLRGQVLVERIDVDRALHEMRSEVPVAFSLEVRE